MNFEHNSNWNIKSKSFKLINRFFEINTINLNKENLKLYNNLKPKINLINIIYSQKLSKKTTFKQNKNNFTKSKERLLANIKILENIVNEKNINLNIKKKDLPQNIKNKIFNKNISRYYILNLFDKNKEIATEFIIKAINKIYSSLVELYISIYSNGIFLDDNDLAKNDIYMKINGLWKTLDIKVRKEKIERTQIKTERECLNIILNKNTKEKLKNYNKLEEIIKNIDFNKIEEEEYNYICNFDEKNQKILNEIFKRTYLEILKNNSKEYRNNFYIKNLNDNSFLNMINNIFNNYEIEKYFPKIEFDEKYKNNNLIRKNYFIYLKM